MSMAIAAVAMQAAGAVSGAIGSYWSAKAQKAQLEGQAALADINARTSELSAQQEYIKGQHEVGRLTLQAGQLKGRQRTALAANGVDLGEGNAAEIQASADILKEIDKNTLEANAVRSAWGYRIQATNYQNEAMMKRAGATGVSPGTQASASLLTGAAQVARSWYSLNNEGAFGG